MAEICAQPLIQSHLLQDNTLKILLRFSGKIQLSLLYTKREVQDMVWLFYSDSDDYFLFCMEIPESFKTTDK